MELDNKKLSELLLLISERLAVEDSDFNLKIAILIKGWLQDPSLSDELKESVTNWSFRFKGR